MKNTLWKFTDNQGSFSSQTADKINTLYFPLCNAHPFMSCVTPTLQGDIKTNFDAFLTQPVSRVDLSNLKASRNFWVYVNPEIIWSAGGVSKYLKTIKTDKFKLEAGMLWQKITRLNRKIGMKAEITTFVPATGEPVEIMLVKLTNISKKSTRFIPTAAIPIYCRSANNLHDHRHVTSLLNRIQLDKFGVIVTPTLAFNESGHIKNLNSYFVLGADEKGRAPQYIYSTQEEFCGDAGDLETPESVLNNLPAKNTGIQGKEAMGGLRFAKKILPPGASCFFIILSGIASDKKTISRIFKKFSGVKNVKHALLATKEFWNNLSAQIATSTQNQIFDNWFRWVSIQPSLRKIFGCSFLPDFDYGKGGRGWRDLWQDCLSLILTHPEKTRFLLINNFKGVRIDGSNATIIGQASGEFIADRNNISRVWMDHGVWPLLTTHLYIHQTADINILFEKIPYFRDRQLFRSRKIDHDWTPEYGKKLKTKSRRIYKGSLLEHILVENLVQFFNVGPHNNIRLEDADWNDGLDMAAEYGESVAFSSMYAQNLQSLCEILEKTGKKHIVILKELTLLLDTLSKPVNYADKSAKTKLLDKYFSSTNSEVSGKQISVPVGSLIKDLKRKTNWLKSHIRKTEWLKEGFFNGYYDNKKRRLEGRINGLTRMTLTGQVFPIMSGVATRSQAAKTFRNVKKYLQDPFLGGLRLNTDFKKEQLSLGRAFSFVYGDKENGSFFSHMNVMFAYALYKQGFVKEGFAVLNSLINMSLDTEKSKIYPCLPEYFNARGRGMYSYLTGSASWFVLTLLTQVFGVRGFYGYLVVEPKLTSAQFKNSTALCLNSYFCGKKISVRFLNPHKKDFTAYCIKKAHLNGKSLHDSTTPAFLCLSRKEFLRLADKETNLIEVTLD